MYSLKTDLKGFSWYGSLISKVSLGTGTGMYSLKTDLKVFLGTDI